MSIVEKYVASEWCKWFALSLFFLFSILFLQMLTGELENFNSLLEIGSSIKWILLGLIGYVPWIVPVACFFSTLVTIAFFKHKGEYIGVLANSISWFHSTRIILVLGVLLSCFCWYSVKLESEIWNYFGSSSKDFRNGAHFQMKISEERFWYFQKFNQSTRVGENVHLYAYDSSGFTKFRIRAKSASWTEQKRWVFEDGQFIGFACKHGLPILNTKSQNIEWLEEHKIKTGDSVKQSPGYSKKFEKLNFEINIDDPDIHILLSQKPKSLSFKKLKELVDLYPKSTADELLPYQYRLAVMKWNVMGSLFSILFAVIICTSNHKQKIGQIIGLSLTGVVLFYVLRTTGDSLGEHGVMPPYITAGIPYLGVIAFACIHYLISRRKGLAIRAFYASTSLSCILSTTLSWAKTLVTVTS